MGVKPVIASKTVTTAGTRVQFTTTSRYVVSIYVEALSTNTGVIYVGDSTVSSTVYMTRLAAGAGFNMSIGPGVGVGSVSGGSEIQLNSIYFDSSVSGEKILVTYMERVGIA